MASSRFQDFKVIEADIVSSTNLPFLNKIIPLRVEKIRLEGELDAQIDKNSFASTEMRGYLLGDLLCHQCNESSYK